MHQLRAPVAAQNMLCPGDHLRWHTMDAVTCFPVITCFGGADLRLCVALLSPLLQDLTPPKDASVRVIVVRDHGSISCSHSASVPLVKGSVHNLRCSEAEHLVRLGVLRVLDPNA
jgi:hypothetical protein